MVMGGNFGGGYYNIYHATHIGLGLYLKSYDQ